MAKDLFSKQSDLYSKYRPGYPIELFEYILQFVSKRDTAWDCATGNGQAAVVLSNYFKKVEATDISEAQLGKAVQKENIYYQISPAEKTPFADDTFDLITVATAYHWLNWEKFHKEATRVGKQNAVVAIWLYTSFVTSDVKLKELHSHFYKAITGPYWDAERKYVDEKYETVGFHFDPLPAKEFGTKLLWNKEQYLGYLSTWSSVQKYIKENRSSPILLIQNELNALWDDHTSKEVYFPISLRLGRISK